MKHASVGTLGALVGIAGFLRRIACLMIRFLHIRQLPADEHITAESPDIQRVQALTFNVFNLTRLDLTSPAKRVQGFIPCEEHVSAAEFTASEVSRSECVDLGRTNAWLSKRILSTTAWPCTKYLLWLGLRPRGGIDLLDIRSTTGKIGRALVNGPNVMLANFQRSLHGCAPTVQRQWWA